MSPFFIPTVLWAFSTFFSPSLKSTEKTYLVPKLVNQEANQIINSKSLNHFFSTLKALETRERDRVSIVHIGDSHIQCDFMSGELRRLFQARFGSRGRGLIFPYKVAKTNGPQDIRMLSTGQWEAKRNVFPEVPIPIGISGISIKALSPNFLLKISSRETEAWPIQKFNRIGLFGMVGPSYSDLNLKWHPDDWLIEKTKGISKPVYHRVKRGEFLPFLAKKFSVSTEEIIRWNDIDLGENIEGRRLKVGAMTYPKSNIDTAQFSSLGQFESSSGQSRDPKFITLDKPIGHCYLSSSQGRGTVIQGISLENTNSRGVLYHMIGVNGAKFESYIASEYFFDQLRSLSADLIIVSLGTNEAYNSNYDLSLLRGDIDEFIQRIKASVQPGTTIIFTTPPDSYVNRKSKNPRTLEVAKAIRNLKDETIAIWDLQEIMGGYGSMRNWKDEGLANNDMVHFLRKGYETQAHLLFEAIFKSYSKP